MLKKKSASSEQITSEQSNAIMNKRIEIWLSSITEVLQEICIDNIKKNKITDVHSIFKTIMQEYANNLIYQKTLQKISKIENEVKSQIDNNEKTNYSTILYSKYFSLIGEIQIKSGYYNNQDACIQDPLLIKIKNELKNYKEQNREKILKAIIEQKVLSLLNLSNEAKIKDSSHDLFTNLCLQILLKEENILSSTQNNLKQNQNPNTIIFSTQNKQLNAKSFIKEKLFKFNKEDLINVNSSNTLEVFSLGWFFRSNPNKLDNVHFKQDPLSLGIYHLKGYVSIESQNKVADSFARLIKNLLNLDSNIIIIAAPSSTANNTQHGATKLAKSISKESDNWIDGTNILIRETTVESSHNGNRKKNKHKNSLKITNHEIIKDSNILLIDDVLTSGKTIKVCKKMLEDAGASNVHLLTLARTASSNGKRYEDFKIRPLCECLDNTPLKNNQALIRNWEEAKKWYKECNQKNQNSFNYSKMQYK